MNKRMAYETQLDRHEAKYIVDPTLVPRILDWIGPFCEPDRHAHGDPPEYTVTTLQLDTPDLALHAAKEREALHRFKLRARTYGDIGSSPVFLEVKRKLNQTIVKSRTMVPFERYGTRLLFSTKVMLPLRSSQEATGFLDFVRLLRETGARPVALVRYVRQCYVGKIDHYARVTIDRRLEYQPTREWASWGVGGRWRPMDTAMAQGAQNGFSGVILELKTLSDAPTWMLDLVMHLNLERVGHCKYSTAMWRESLFRGTPRSPNNMQEMFS